MQEQTASRTALGTAFLRAAHQILDRPPLLFADPVAVPMLGTGAVAYIRAQEPQFQTPTSQAMRTHVCLRARVAEDRLAEAVAAGTGCYVLLGAGFDSFAWRQPDWAKAIRIVEIDHPATQADKHRRLAAAGLAKPDNLDFVAADFARESVADVLARAGLVRDHAVFFSWLGVSMYLSEAAVDACLAAIAAYRARLVMTFRQPGPSEDALDARVADLGEPFLSRFTSAQMEAKLRTHGFADICFETRERTSARLAGTLPVPRQINIVYAATA